MEKWPHSEIVKWIAHFSLSNDEVEEALNPKPKIITLPEGAPREAEVEIFRGIL